MKKGKFNIVIGGMAGSESKGKLSAWLVDRVGVDLMVMTASPNAGHTVIKPDGSKHVSYHLPVGCVMGEMPIILGPASLINPTIFKNEIATLGIDPSRIYLDNRASLITDRHLSSEANGGMSDIGSTLQGIGECRMDKMRRGTAQHLVMYYADAIQDMIPGINLISDTSSIIKGYLDRGQMVLAEATQGFDLDLEHGIDPRYCTSKMINPAMVMAEAGIPPTYVGDIYGVIRPYPIRVNNRTGTSGPYAEAAEITWEEVARRCGHPSSLPGNIMPPAPPLAEITTTTKLPRRVFEFSVQRFIKFVDVCGPTHICLQFANYLDWGVYGVRDADTLLNSAPVVDFLNLLLRHAKVTFVGTGPGHLDMIELGDYHCDESDDCDCNC